MAFMYDTQIPYTKDTSEKAFHFEEDYYSKLKLRYKDYNALFNSICNAINNKIEELNDENKKLSSNINNLEAQISLLKRGE